MSLSKCHCSNDVSVCAGSIPVSSISRSLSQYLGSDSSEFCCDKLPEKEDLSNSARVYLQCEKVMSLIEIRPMAVKLCGPGFSGLRIRPAYYEIAGLSWLWCRLSDLSIALGSTPREVWSDYSYLSKDADQGVLPTATAEGIFANSLISDYPGDDVLVPAGWAEELISLVYGENFWVDTTSGSLAVEVGNDFDNLPSDSELADLAKANTRINLLPDPVLKVYPSMSKGFWQLRLDFYTCAKAERSQLPFEGLGSMSQSDWYEAAKIKAFMYCKKNGYRLVLNSSSVAGILMMVYRKPANSQR